MHVTDDDLEDLIEDQGEYVSDLQQGDNPEDPIGYQLYLESEQMVYAALEELRAWRQSHPDEEMESMYMTEFGPMRTQ